MKCFLFLKAFKIQTYIFILVLVRAVRTFYVGLNVVHSVRCHVLNHFPLYPLLSLIIHVNTLGGTRLHQEQSHLQQQDAHQDVPDSVGNPTELLHYKYLSSTVYN